MPEYDAFGREVGEDPLAALRDATAAPTEPVSPEPAVAAEPVAAEFAPPVAVRPQFVRRRRRGGSVAGLIVVATVIGGVGLVVNGLVSRVEDIASDLPGLAEPEPVKGTLLRPAKLSAAIEIIRVSNLGDPIRLRIAPRRIDVTLGGGLGVSRMRIDGDLGVRTSGVEPRDFPRPVPLRRIDVTAPQRLAAGREVRYVELVRGRPVRWRAVLADGTRVVGDATGRSAGS